MKKINKKALKVIAIVAETEVIRMKESKVTECSGIFHQPKRPTQKRFHVIC